jgi:hypothetical protein
MFHSALHRSRTPESEAPGAPSVTMVLFFATKYLLATRCMSAGEMRAYKSYNRSIVPGDRSDRKARATALATASVLFSESEN